MGQGPDGEQAMSCPQGILEGGPRARGRAETPGTQRFLPLAGPQVTCVYFFTLGTWARVLTLTPTPIPLQTLVFAPHSRPDRGTSPLSKNVPERNFQRNQQGLWTRRRGGPCRR